MTSLEKKSEFLQSEHIKLFLDEKYAKKYLISFEVGKDKTIFYGNPLIMATNSGLMQSLLDEIDVSENYHPLAREIKINNPNVLKLIWLSLNGVISKELEIMSLFSILDIIEGIELFNYFDVSPDIRYFGYFITHFEELIRTEKKFVEHIDRIINILNKLINIYPNHLKKDLLRIIHYFNNEPELEYLKIHEKINFILIYGWVGPYNYSPESFVKKSVTDKRELQKIVAESLGMDPDKTDPDICIGRVGSILNICNGAGYRITYKENSYSMVNV